MKFECPSCSQLILNVSDDLAGKRGKCPHCQKVIKIPMEGIVMTAPPSPPRPPVPPASAPRSSAQSQSHLDPQYPSEDSFLNVDSSEDIFAQETLSQLPSKKKRRKKKDHKTHRPESNRYQMLKLYLSTIRIIAYVAIGFAVVIFAIAVFAPALYFTSDKFPDLVFRLITGGVWLLGALTSAMVILGGVEFVQLFIDIERQLRKNGDFLESIESRSMR